MAGLTKRRKFGSKPKLSESKPMDQGTMAPGKELGLDEGGMKPGSRQLALSTFKEGDSFRLFGKEFRIESVEGDKVSVKNLETGTTRTFKPSMKVSSA